jgi:hypothetical protein
LLDFIAWHWHIGPQSFESGLFGVGTGGEPTRAGQVVFSCLNGWLNVGWRGETVLTFQEGSVAFRHHNTSLAGWTPGIGDLGSAVCLPRCT